jgi:protein-disulfide isomerase
MSAKKRRRQQRAARAPGREPTVARAQARPAGRRASPRILFAAAATTAVVAGGIIAGFALTSGSSKPPPIPAGALPGAAEVQALLTGIPQNGNVLGNPSAPVQVIEYADIQCPYCRDAESHTFSDVIARYVRPGKASLELRLLGSMGPDSTRGRLAALAAGRQGKLFDLVALLFRSQGTENTGWLTGALVRHAARSIPGLEVTRLVADMSSPEVENEARVLESQIAHDHVTETPTIFVGKRGGTPRRVKLTSSVDMTTLPAAIDAATR